MLTTYDPSLLLEQIDHLKETCDYVVVYVHWGIEKKGPAGGVPALSGKAVY